MILLPWLPWCWDYTNAPPHPASPTHLSEGRNNRADLSPQDKSKSLLGSSSFLRNLEERAQRRTGLVCSPPKCQWQEKGLHYPSMKSADYKELLFPKGSIGTTSQSKVQGEFLCDSGQRGACVGMGDRGPDFCSLKLISAGDKRDPTFGQISQPKLNL